MATGITERLLIRRLPAEEYPRLKTVHEGFCPPADISMVFVAEEDGEIVGRSMLLSPFHVEGPWVDESKRGTTLAFRLVRETETAAKSMGHSKILAYAVNAQIENYLSRMGYARVPMTVWEKTL